MGFIMNFFECNAIICSKCVLIEFAEYKGCEGKSFIYEACLVFLRQQE